MSLQEKTNPSMEPFMAVTIHRGGHVPASPQFSVIVIAYNSEPYLREAVQSAVDQDLPGVEVIVVDDGSRLPVSTTLPPDLAKRCVIIRKQNAGIAAARNTGIRACRSPYIALLDGDDCMLPSHCRVAREAFQADPQTDVLVPDAYILSSGVDRCTVRHSLRYPRIHPITFDNYVKGISPLVGWSTMRRDCVERFCYLDEEFRNGGEDFHHFAKLLAMGARFRYLQSPTYEYRRHDGSITYSQPIHMANCILRALEKLASEAIFSTDMLDLLEDYRHRTAQLLAWYQFRDSFSKRDFTAAARWLPTIQTQFIPSTASRLKFYCAVVFMRAMLMLRPQARR